MKKQLILVASSFLLAKQVLAVDVCVDGKFVSLAAALNEVITQNEPNNIIRIQAGKHLAPNGGWQLQLPANANLVIQGGYVYSPTLDCFERDESSMTILDGGGAQRPLTIIAQGNSNIEISELAFHNGKANDQLGGGLLIMGSGGMGSQTYSGDILIENNTFGNNTVPDNGTSMGGGLAAGTAGDLNVRNNLFAGNSAGNAYAAFLWNDEPLINQKNAAYVGNNTFSGNIPLPGGAGPFFAVQYDAPGTTAMFTNNIFWGNLIVGQPTFDIDLSNPITLSKNDIERVGNGLLPAGNFSVDPLFVNAANGNFRLSAASSLIGQGENNPSGGTTNVDLDGMPRKIGTIDLGAYEFDRIFKNGFDN